MISVFQIFRILIGSIVFIFILIFFLRISQLYSGVQETGVALETVNAFNHIAMQTYTSGNPAEFDGFAGFETVVYDAPKIKSDAGQKTLSVPVFMVPDRGQMSLERECLDYAWFRFCWVYAFPKSAKFIFSFVDNSDASRSLVEKIVEMLPDGLEYGYCDGESAQFSGKQNFLGYLDSLAGSPHEPCNVSVPEGSRLVYVGDHPGISGNMVTVDASSMAGKENFSGTVKTEGFKDVLDAAVFIIGGKGSLDYKKERFAVELEAAADIMRRRTVLTHQSMQKYNVQPCEECATPQPAACGWKAYDGAVHQSAQYLDFISSLGLLRASIASGNFQGRLDDTVSKYEELENQGCE